MANVREREKDLDSEFGSRRNMKREKPQQQIYVPGSGPLRKSNLGPGEEPDLNHDNHSYKSDRNLDQRFDDMSLNRNAPRRQKKPEQQLYVPKPLVHARETQSSREYDQNSYPQVNGNDNERFSIKGKRFSTQRRRNDNEHHDEWRNKPQNNHPRHVRQGSEPRGMANGLWQRTRDTRSVEPSGPPPRQYNSEKIQSKPPSGRRHSTVGVEYDKRHKPSNLPPRLRKKFESENNFVPHTEEVWDGNSVMFQGSSNHLKNPSYHQMNYMTASQPHLDNNAGYFTLPNRPRGRGRLQQHDYEHTAPGFRSPGSSRPASPPVRYDSRPQTPRNEEDYRNSNEMPRKGYLERRKSESREMNREMNERRSYNNNKRREPRRRRYNSRRDSNANQNNKFNDEFERRSDREEDTTPTPQQINEFSESLEAQLSPVSPEMTNEERSQPINHIGQTYDKSLDWSEEVELSEKLESEALSDALTRSSSVTSLIDVSTKSMPAPSTAPKKSRRNGSRSREQSGSRQSRQSSVDNREFKVPESRGRRRRQSRDKRDSSYDRYSKSRNSSRECSFDRNRKSSTSEHSENWRDEIRRSRQNSERDSVCMSRSRNNSEMEEIKLTDGKKAGIIVLPTAKVESTTSPPILANFSIRREEKQRSPSQQKSLFDPNNPSKPIIVKAQSSRVNVGGFGDSCETMQAPQMHNDPMGSAYPYWFDENTDHFKHCNYPELLRDIRTADLKLQQIINNGHLLIQHQTVEHLRDFLKQALGYLLCSSLRFCERENVEQHFWNILYHNMIELTRKSITSDPDNKEMYKKYVLYLVEDGTTYFENLLGRLEYTYEFKINDFVGNLLPAQKGGPLVKLALISVQKLFLFLGDLVRYREEVNESANYGKCRQWYIKSQEINPKNGKPYNQLALLAVKARRRLDAVYYYMRSLMSSNPFLSAKENLNALFDENRKKFEQGEKKRREERLERARKQMKQKESENNVNGPNSLRKETWIHPEGGRRVHRTTQSVQDQKDSEEEDLAALGSVEVNKRFVISYLHVHGKLSMRIGMESFQEAALQMLKEFRALLQHSPVPIPCNRFLQLLALNMFAIENTQFKDPQLQSQPGYRSEYQERALIVSLQMFNLILERCVSILQDHLATSSQTDINSLPPDANVLLPAIKIWCDWMMCHIDIWNPPPSTNDYKVGASGDAWSRLAVLMNLLEQIYNSAPKIFVNQQQEGYEVVLLPEDGVLNGFTPLMNPIEEQDYAPVDFDNELAQFTLRLKKLLFFGTTFLCGLEPPVLKLEIEDHFRTYVSVVCTSNSRDSPPSPAELTCNNDVLLESVSGDEEEPTVPSNHNNIDTDGTSSEIRDLWNRKMELERRHRYQEMHLQQVKKILSQSVVRVHIEVRPEYLVPDTNCFIDYLDQIGKLASYHSYTIMVPIVVLSELEGLARGGRSPVPGPRTSVDPEHIIKVGEAAKKALEFLKSRHQSVKCITTKGAILTSTAFTTEDDSSLESNLKNDDKILTTCLAFCKGQQDQQGNEGQPRQLVRKVVLLTDDRNLRVKAYARDVPVRELPDFMRWAGMG